MPVADPAGPLPEPVRSNDVLPSAAERRTGIVLAALCVLFFTTAFLNPGIVNLQAHGRFTSDPFYMRAIYRFNVALCGGFLTAWLLEPVVRPALGLWASQLSRKTRRGIAFLVVAGVCAAFSVFIIHYGRWQFGGFDYNILLEIGWRQILGQRSYVDFLTTSPPLFNLGMYLAFRIFGVSWDGMLFFTAVFTAGTLVWVYLLLRRSGMGTVAALGVACTIESATMLSCCFWWYNNSTLLLAAIFFLSALLLTRSLPSRFAQASFVVSLALLSLGKPNIAGVTIVGCLCLLLVAAERPTRVLLLTIAGGALAVLLLAATHVSVPAMLAAYRGAAKERGAFSSFGFDEFSLGEKDLIFAWYAALCLPLLGLIPRLRAALRSRDRRALAYWLFFPLAALIAIYGLRGNGEMRDVETAVLVCALGLLAFSTTTRGRPLRRYTAALLCAMTVSNLYAGAARDRVYTIAPQKFFEWTDRDHLVDRGRFKNMRVSGTFVAVNDEIEKAVAAGQGPYFFGPRIDYSYMLLGLPSPRNFPAWWHPGTAFDRAKVPSLVQVWSDARFGTLVFLKDEYVFYPRSIMDEIETKYTRDDHNPYISVYRRRPGF